MLAIVAGTLGSWATVSGQSPEFPPGRFVESGPLRISDFKGKALVLCFYDPLISEDWSDAQVPRWVMSNWGGERAQPVCFVCVACGMTVGQVRADQTETPPVRIFVDSWRVMEHRVGGPRPKAGRWRYTVIGPDGIVVGNPGDDAGKAAEGIGHILSKARWNYRTPGVPNRLDKALEALEYGEFETGARLTRREFSDSIPQTAQAAKDLYERLRSGARTWAERAAAAENTDPVAARDIYARIAAILPNDEQGRSAIRSVRKLEGVRDVRAEMGARGAYAKLEEMSDLGRKAIPEAVGVCRAIAEKFPAAPTGLKCAQLADELAALPPPPAPPAAPEFALHIENFYGAAGQTMLYQVTPEAVAVGVVSDWAGQGPRELYRAALTPGQRDGLGQFLKGFPLKELETVYEDARVNDGFQCSFGFRLARQPAKTIRVANRRVREIEALRVELNRILPERLRIGQDSSFRGR